MLIKCPKCFYIRIPTDVAPDYECPKCGVVYAKVGQRPLPRDAGDTVPQDLEPPRRNIVLDASQKLALACLCGGLCVGYFAGREHVKYEMRSMFNEAAQGIRKGMEGVAASTGMLGMLEAKTAASRLASPATNPSAQPSVPTAAQPFVKPQAFPVTATLKSKGYEEGAYGRGEIVFTVAFTNSTPKNIRAFDGALVFQDLLGNEILNSRLAVNDPVAAGSTYDWAGKIDYNQFKSSHENLRGADIQNVRLQFLPKKVLFEDGEVKEF